MPDLDTTKTQKMYKPSLNINQDENFIFMLDMNMDAPAGSCFKTTVVPTTLKGIAMRKAWEAAHSTTPSVAPLAQSKAQITPVTPTSDAACFPKTPLKSKPVLLRVLTPEAKFKRKRSRTASMLLPAKAELKAEPVQCASLSPSLVANEKNANVGTVTPRRLPAHLRRCSDDAPTLAMPSAGASVCDKPRSPAHTRHLGVLHAQCQQRGEKEHEEGTEPMANETTPSASKPEAKVAPVCVSREGAQNETIWERKLKNAVDAAYDGLLDHATALLRSWAF